MRTMPLRAHIPSFYVPSAGIEHFESAVLAALKDAFPSFSEEEVTVAKEALRLCAHRRVKDLEEFTRKFLDVVSVCFHSNHCGGKSLTTKLPNLQHMLKEYRTERVTKGRRREVVWFRTYSWESLRYHYVIVTSLQNK